MKFLDFIKKDIEEEYNLEDIDDIVYDDSEDELELLDDVDNDHKKQITEISEKLEEDYRKSHNETTKESVEDNTTSQSAIHEEQEQEKDSSDQKKEHKHHESKAEHDHLAEERRKRAQLEEERFDHLLNSVQAQDLLKTVDKLNENQAKKERVKKEFKESERQEEKENQRSLSSRVDDIRLNSVQRNAQKHLQQLMDQEEKSENSNTHLTGHTIQDITTVGNVYDKLVRSGEDAMSEIWTHDLDHSEESNHAGRHGKKKVKWPHHKDNNSTLDGLETESTSLDKGHRERVESVNKYLQQMKQEENEFEQKAVHIPDVSRKPKELDRVNIKQFNSRDLTSYVTEQCEIMEEATRHIDQAMEEYNEVTEYFTDVQKIEEAPDHIQIKIAAEAEKVNNLTVDRRISKTTDNRLSSSTYYRLEQLEDEVPRGFQYIQRQETYYETVKRDMRILEGERLGLRLEAKSLSKRQARIKSISLTAVIGLAIVFGVFAVALVALEEDKYTSLFIIVAFLGGFLALGLFTLLRMTQREVLLTEIRLNKASSLLNKTKIKYINAANTLDYEYAKYHVKSSYELDKKYQTYLQMKEEKKKVLRMTTTLHNAEEDLTRLLESLHLYDTHVWLGRVKALFDQREMVEVRHDLSVQRQKLRNLIEYNDKRIEEAKRNIRNVTTEHPECTHDALKIIDDYEKKKRV